jgi:uncharacterized Zn-binding protein involved in type VI secretion
MPQISRDGDITSTGHGCTRAIGVISSNIKVYANGIPLLRVGDRTRFHVIKFGRYCVPHSANVNRGSSSVVAQGISVARVGDSTDFGSLMTGSGNVFAGG